MDERSIFLNALEQEDPKQRMQYLDEACQGNEPLRRKIEALFRASNDAGSFLETPPAGLAATIATGQFAAFEEGAEEVSLEFLLPSEKPGCLGILAQYEVVEVVGRGGMGLVLRAFDPKLNRIVAIKVMAPELAASPMAVKRFLREAKAAAAVSHDHVVTIHSIHDSHRPPFLVMEFIDGQSLQQKLDRTGALELHEVLRIGIQMASGLAAAHKQGLVHRDIKPANILLENGVERVKITDFGLARAVDDVGVTQTGQIAGTPQYMSPEQAQGQPVDARSDLFSLGSVLYTLCTGRPPFRGDTAVAMLRRVCDDTPRPLREVNPEIPDWLEAIVDKLLAKHPDDRWQTAMEVCELLNGHLAHLQNPGTAPRPWWLPRSDEFAELPPQKPSPIVPFDAPDRDPREVQLAIATLLFSIVLACGLCAAMWFYKSTSYGIVVFESPVDTLEIERLQDGEVARVYDTLHNGGTQWHVPVGEWEFRIKGNGADYRLEPNRIDVERGSRTTIRIEVAEAGKVDSTTTLMEVGRLEGHLDTIDCLAYSRDGKYLFSGGGEKLLFQWDVAKREIVRTFPGDSFVVGVAPHPDGERVFASHFAGSITLWNLATGRAVRKFVGHTGQVRSLAVTPDGKYLLSGGTDGLTRLWDVDSGASVRSFSTGFCSAVAFTTYGTIAAHDGTTGIEVWEVATGKTIRKIARSGSAVYALAFSRDGRFLAAGNHEGEIRVWDANSGDKLYYLDGHTAAIKSLICTPDGRYLISGSDDKSIRVFEWASGKQIYRIDCQKTYSQFLSLAPDGHTFASGGGMIVIQNEAGQWTPIKDGDYAIRLWRLP